MWSCVWASAVGGGGLGGSGWMAELSSMSSCSGLIRAVLLPLQ